MELCTSLCASCDSTHAHAYITSLCRHPSSALIRGEGLAPYLGRGVSCQEGDRGMTVLEITNLPSLSFQPKDPGVSRFLWELLAYLCLLAGTSSLLLSWRVEGRGPRRRSETRGVSDRRNWGLCVPHPLLPPTLPQGRVARAGGGALCSHPPLHVLSVTGKVRAPGAKTS